MYLIGALQPKYALGKTLNQFGECLFLMKREWVEQPSTILSTSTSILLSPADAAALLGLTVWQVRGLITNGELQVIRVGRRLYLRRQSLMRWAEQREERYCA